MLRLNDATRLRGNCGRPGLFFGFREFETVKPLSLVFQIGDQMIPAVTLFDPGAGQQNRDWQMPNRFRDPPRQILFLRRELAVQSALNQFQRLNRSEGRKFVDPCLSDFRDTPLPCSDNQCATRSERDEWMNMIRLPDIIQNDQRFLLQRDLRKDPAFLVSMLVMVDASRPKPTMNRCRCSRMRGSSAPIVAQRIPSGNP